MDEESYREHEDRRLLEYESLCRRCGSCCGAEDGDPCKHLVRDPDGRYMCDIYANRFGLKKTVKGNEISCVPIRKMINKNWVGRSRCAYVRKGKALNLP